MSSTYIVRHDNNFDNPSTWAFNNFQEAAILRDHLNKHGGASFDGEYHVEEEVHYPTAAHVIKELQNEGWFEEDEA